MLKTFTAALLALVAATASAAPAGVQLYLENGLGAETSPGGLVLLVDPSMCRYLGELKRTPREANGPFEEVAKKAGADTANWSITIREKVCRERRTSVNLTVMLPMSPAESRGGAGYRAATGFMAFEIR
ncbi:hypothetical protein ABIC83_003082 [Roseateles asaccharophilus]|uniref:hypothetical protein n=1 Tax=Roseateles asaccharophilus TaxID=582607 RepID=UPI003834AE34